MNKPKLRSTFNFIIAISLIWYIVLIFVIDIGTIGSIIYWSLFFILIVLRDAITPKKKQRAKAKKDKN